MAASNQSTVSSNWKKLQATFALQKKEKPEAQSNGLKRKRIDEKPKQTWKVASAFKKARLTGAHSLRVEKTRTKAMGMGQSQPAATTPTAADTKAKLVKEHGISKDDIAAAYGARQDGIKCKDDIANGGRHPTHKTGRYVALDCEMVGTGPPPHTDNVLARASLVNFHGEQIYDSYVQPPAGIEVKDYRTFVSGIKPSHMVKGYARTFAEVQRDVADLLQDRVLVGHALSNDLRVLLLSHPKRDLRDTSRHPKFREASMGKPPALRDLTKRELGIKIQTGEHSSVEDARAAMMLYKKEKTGFEEDNRKRFGARKPPNKANGKAETKALSPSPDAEDDEDGDESDEEDLDLLDGEDEGLEDAEEGGVSTNATAPKAKKKRKKKKRTKRH